jgi:hypothetical protein
MSRLSANLSAIAGVLGSAPPPLPTTDGRLRLLQSGLVPVLSLATPSGADVALNSGRDPLREALGLLEAAVTDRPNPKVVVAVGLGLGFIIDAIEQKYPDAKIVALEPEPGCVGPFLERRDLTGLLANRRLLLLWGPDYVGSSEAWKFFDGDVEAPPIVRHPALYRQNPDSFTTALKIVGKMVFGVRSNAEARKKFAGRYLLNTLRNLPAIARSGDAGALFGAFGDVPGIVVSAGPSLDANLPDLAAVANRAVLISVDTALRPLLSARIDPHVVVAVDPSAENAGHLQRLPDMGATYLVAEGSLDPAAFPEFGDRCFTFKVSDHEPWPWLRTLDLDRATLRAWGSVATSAFDLALRIGCNPIVFVGQDLAHTGGQPYCRGTTFEATWAEFAVDGSTVADIWRTRYGASASMRLSDFRGEPTQTTPSLVAFRDWLVEQCGQRADRRFVNATGAGILMGRGLEQGSLATAIPRRELAQDPFAVLHAARRRSGDASDRVEAATRALLQGLDSAALPAAIAAWQEFAVGTVTTEAIRVVLAGPSHSASHAGSRPRILHLSAWSLSVIASLRGLGPRHLLPSTSRSPERVAVIQAITADGDAPAWATTTSGSLPGETPDVRTLVEAATRALCRLLSLPEPVGGLLPGHERLGTAASAAVSLTAPFDWVPAARPDVDLIEQAAHVASRLAADNPSPTDPTDAFRWSVASTQTPVLHRADGALPVGIDLLTWWARRAIVIEWALLLKALPAAAAGELAALACRLAEWVRDVAEGPIPGSLADATTTIEGRLEEENGETGHFRFELRAPLWRLTRAITGAIVDVSLPGREAIDRPADSDHPVGPELTVPVDGGGRSRIRCSIVAEPARLPGAIDPRMSFFRGRDGWVTPTVVVLPRAYMASRVDDGTALVTPHLARSSWAIDAGGRLTALAEWPHPILGERRGAGTSGVAWSNVGAGYIMRRASDVAPVEVVVPPFRPIRTVVLEDGTSLWAAMGGGLWAWALDGQIECLAPTPALAGVAMHLQGIRLDPMARDVTGQAHRRVLTHGWLWHPDSRTLDTIDLGPLGQMSSHAQGAGGWWAAAHPAIDIIRVGDGAGASWDLACDSPNDVAWAGDSLLAATAQGTVLRFAHLASVLANRAAASTGRHRQALDHADTDC